MDVNQPFFIKDLSACPAPPITVDRDTTSPLSHMNNDITTNNETPTQSSANYINYETSENPVSQPNPENGSQTVDTVISKATPVLRRSLRVTKLTPCQVNLLRIKRLTDKSRSGFIAIFRSISENMCMIRKRFQQFRIIQMI